MRPEGLRSTVRQEPVGPVAAFAPWNFPIGNPGRKLGAPIAAGCSVILKAAEETPASALAYCNACLMRAFRAKWRRRSSAYRMKSAATSSGRPIIRKLSFTGSTVVGKHLAKLAADNMIRTTMELGGHGPVLVFDDADVDNALATGVGKYRNCGQVCVSPTRFIVQENVFEKFREGFVEGANGQVVGNGMEDGTTMGPMANARRPEAMDSLIGDAAARAPGSSSGGERIGNQGYFYAPTVLSEMPLDAE